MAKITYRTNPSNGIKYAYTLTSVWDKEKKCPRTKATYLGRVDPRSGEIIPPSSGKGRVTLPPQDTGGTDAGSESKSLKALNELVQEKDVQIKELQESLRKSEALVLKLRKKLEKIAAIVNPDIEQGF